jgi:two-component system sensor histidine kinase KdpD
VALEVAMSLATLIACTLIAYLLKAGLGLADASPVYLLGVSAVAIAYGAPAAVATAVGAFLTYNFLFIEPRYTFAVAQPSEFLTLIVLLVIGILIGRLAGRQRDREQQAERREREARALYSISRSLNVADSLDEAAAKVVQRVAREAQMERVWFGISPETGHERILADSRSGEPLPEIGGHSVLRRDPAEGDAAWLRVHPPRRRTGDSSHSAAYFRVELRVGDSSFGSLWAARRRELEEPHVEESRLMAAAADQVAQAIRRQLLAASAAELEIASRSDELKSALLDSVSHDLRTPLATIRAAAGSLVDPSVPVSDGKRIRLGAAIDSEADRLNRLVTNLLDMSRIEGGELHPDLELLPVVAIIEPVLERMAAVLISHRMDVEVPDGLPPVWADPLMLDQVLTNLLENAAKYAPRGARIRVGARISDEADALDVVIEDAGAGVPESALPQLFDKFYRVPQRAEGARRGTGLGLAVVEGLVRAMGGEVTAHRSALGGLAIVIHLPTRRETGVEGAEETDFAVNCPDESKP